MHSLEHRRITRLGILNSETSRHRLNLQSGPVVYWRILKRLPATLSLGILAACTTLGPDYQQPVTSVQATWTVPESTQYSASGQVSDDEFWAGFNDKTLLELLRHAQSKSPTLKSAALQVDAARETIRINAAPQLPSVTATGSRNYTQPDTTSKQRGVNDGSFTDQFLGQISWELDFWGKYRRGEQADQASLESSKAALESSLVSLKASVANAYVNARIYANRIDVANANLREQAENMRIAEARYRLGASSEIDWRQAQTQFEQTQSQIPALRSSLEQNQNALSVLIGETPDYFAKHYGASLAADLPKIPAVLPLGVPADLLRRRPDVRQAEFTAISQSARIGQAEAALYPSFSLSGSIGFQTMPDGRDLFSWDSRTINYGAGFSFPLFDRGALLRKVKVQDINFQQAILAYQNQVLTAQQNVEDALSSFFNSKAQLDALGRAYTAAKRSTDLSLRRYLNGLTDFTTVTNAQQSQLQTSDSLVQAQSSVLLAAISAYRSVGGGWTPPTPTATLNPTAHVSQDSAIP
jgi:NodT family efflux transporter outer membrane factor (OMF) lipoprotein